MMNKIASDAYSQGAYEALAQLNLSGHVKEVEDLVMDRLNSIPQEP